MEHSIINLTDLEAKAREERKKYYKNWRSQNKDKLKKYSKSYWEKKALENVAKA